MNMKKYMVFVLLSGLVVLASTLVMKGSEKAYPDCTKIDQQSPVIVNNNAPLRVVLTESELKVIRQGGTAVTIQKPTTVLTTVAFITTPNLEMDGPWGLVFVQKSTGLKSVAWGESLSIDDIPKFPFFSSKPTTIGILYGTIDKGLGSTQRLLFMDTASDRRVWVTTRNREAPRWVFGAEGLPVGVDDLRWDAFGLKGHHIYEKPRVARSWRFSGQRKIRDRDREQQLFREEAANLDEFSEQDLKRLKSDKGRLWSLDIQLIDTVYYWSRLGRVSEVERLLAEVNPELREQLLLLLNNPDGYAPEIEGNVVDPFDMSQMGINALWCADTFRDIKTQIREASVTAEHDFVSGYSMEDALLEDLPWRLNATKVGPSYSFHFDEWVEVNHSDWTVLQHGLAAPLFEEKDSEDGWAVSGEQRSPSFITLPAYHTVDVSTCRLHDGGFFGEIYRTNDIVKARPRRRGFLISPIQIADFDHDGYMDLLCGVGYNSGGSICPSGEIVLSRKSKSVPFSAQK